MSERYASASEIVRNLSAIRIPFAVLHEEGKLRIIQFEKPYFDGYEFWVVNEKGFMWEPAPHLDDALAYLLSEEALAYNEPEPEAERPIERPLE
jgi:hypothetical protein